MYEALSAYLDAVATPEQKALCLESCYTLAEAGLDGPEDQIDQELAVTENIDGDFIVNLMENILIPYYRQVSLQFGITLTDEVSLKYVTDILKGLQLLENYDDPDTIVSLCQVDEDSAEILCDLLEIVGQYTSFDYHSQLDHVSHELIDKIAEIVQRPTVRDTEVNPSQEQIDRARVRVLAYLQMISEADGEWLRSRFREGLRLAMPFKTLCKAFHVDLEAAWSQSIDRACMDAVGLVLASDALPQELQPMLSDYAQNYFADISQSTAFRSQSQMLLKGFIEPGVSAGG